MTALQQIVLWVAYLSLLAELVLLHVPSVASSRSIFIAPAETVAGYSSRQQAVFAMPTGIKLLLFGVPLVIIYGVFALPLVVSVMGPDPLSDYLFAPDPMATAAGIAFIVGGRLLTLWSTLTIRVDNQQQDEAFFLHTTGAFRFSRNPGLVGMFAFIGGCWLLLPSLGMGIGIGLYIAYMNVKVRMEEDFLQNRFGDDYTSYCRQTARFLW